jgi:hypothetical protein
VNQIELFRRAASESAPALSIKLPHMTDEEFVSTLCKGLNDAFDELSLRTLAIEPGIAEVQRIVTSVPL